MGHGRKDMASRDEEMWEKAKKRCNLNNDDVALAKKFNMNPRKLIKNNPSKSEAWKIPTKDWLRSIEEKNILKAERKTKAKAKKMVAPKAQETLVPKEAQTQETHDIADRKGSW
jgi:hypothetical protein